jgi:uncharacterized membrane protein YbhN (UPF0104 family)
VLAVAGLAVLGHVRRHQLQDVLDTLAHLRWEWVVPAILAESGSMIALARSQRALLTVRGDRLRLGPAVAIVYASNALSLTVPVAGAGLGAGFSFRQFRRRGVNAELVGWALTVSGVMSAGGRRARHDEAPSRSRWRCATGSPTASACCARSRPAARRCPGTGWSSRTASP